MRVILPFHQDIRPLSRLLSRCFFSYLIGRLYSGTEAHTHMLPGLGFIFWDLIDVSFRLFCAHADNWFFCSTLTWLSFVVVCFVAKKALVIKQGYNNDRGCQMMIMMMLFLALSTICPGFLTFTGFSSKTNTAAGGLLATLLIGLFPVFTLV